MKAIRHILVAIDFTPPCLAALREATRLASLNGAALTAVHVMDEFLVHELQRGLAMDEQAVVTQWRGYLEKFVHESGLGVVNAGIDVMVGHPLTGLTQACRLHDADLLVMGARGSRRRSPRVGPVAAKCVRKVPANVLLVSEDAQGPYKHLAVCVDFSDNSAKAVRAALTMADQDGATLDCVHIYQSAVAMSVEYGGLGMELLTPDPEIVKLREQELADFLEPLRKGSNVAVRHVILERMNIREAIQDHILENHIDLVVLGTRGKNGLRELLMGTTAEKIVSHAPCSVLAIKPERFAQSWID